MSTILLLMLSLLFLWSSAFTEQQSANHNNSKCLSKIFIPHLWTQSSVKIIRIMLSCIYYFSLISTEFCLPFHLWLLKITSSVHSFVVSLRFCHFEEFCSISKLCHLVKLLLFQIICNCDENCRSYEASLLIRTSNFFASWKLFNYPYTILPIFSPSIGLFSRNSLVLDAADKKFPQDSRSISSDTVELNGVVFISEIKPPLWPPRKQKQSSKVSPHLLSGPSCFPYHCCWTVRAHSYWVQTCITNISQKKRVGMQTSKQPPVSITSHYLAVHSHVSPQASSIPENSW